MMNKYYITYLLSSGPPSAPRNVISAINETSVILDWTWPADSGGRKDMTFNVVCKRCWPSPRQCEPCRGAVRFLPRATGLTNTTVTVVDLLAHTNYTFEIEVQNGVSSLAPTVRQYAAVTITTNQAGESPISKYSIVKGKFQHPFQKKKKQVIIYSHSCRSETPMMFFQPETKKVIFLRIS